MATGTNALKRRSLTGLPSETAIHRAGPFLKWAGGKSQLLNSFEQFFPTNFSRYFEPFTGGAAVFFHLQNQHADFQAQLSDQNSELINCYQIVKNDVELLIDALQKHENIEEHFYQTRAQDPNMLSAVQRAARLIYLNKTCFNGLYRVNSKGQFNVPFGFYKSPAFCNETNLRACSRLLQNTELHCRSFEEILQQARKGDFVYFDPPYHPLTKTSNFTSYTKTCFSERDQELLADTFAKLDKRGCKVMLSNSDCAFIRTLYRQFRIEQVLAMRAINCKASGRGRISELVILNY